VVELVQRVKLGPSYWPCLRLAFNNEAVFGSCHEGDLGGCVRVKKFVLAVVLFRLVQELKERSVDVARW
jgi:hypothetical protein